MRMTMLPILLTLAAFSTSFISDKGEDRGSEEKNIEIYDGPIIDMHIHAFNAGNNMFGMDYLNPLTGRRYVGVKNTEEQKTETFFIFKKYNVVKAVVSNGNAWYDHDPERVIIGESHYNSVEQLRAWHNEGKLHILGEVAPNYQGLLPTDSSLVKYFDLAEELQIPMAYHLFPGGPPGGAYFAYPNTRAHQGKPLQLEEILFSRPKMKIYIMHAGWPYLEDMKALMYAHPQVYVDTGVIGWVLPRKEFHCFVQGLVDAGFGKRIMFGSDQMVWPNTIVETIDAINSAQFLTLEQKADIFFHNAATFLNLSPDEVTKYKRMSVDE